MTLAPGFERDRYLALSMTYYPDLAPNDYFDREWAYRLAAVGWLDPAYPFPRGKVPDDVLKKLAAILRDPDFWQPVCARGFLLCGFCNIDTSNLDRELERLRIVYEGLSVTPIGIGNLFVPGNKRVYIAPEMILHYILAHGYKPPEEFCIAVRACPPMGSTAFAIATQRAGPRAFRWYEFPGRPVQPLPLLVLKACRALGFCELGYESDERDRRRLGLLLNMPGDWALGCLEHFAPQVPPAPGLIRHHIDGRGIYAPLWPSPPTFAVPPYHVPRVVAEQLRLLRVTALLYIFLWLLDLPRPVEVAVFATWLGVMVFLSLSHLPRGGCPRVSVKESDLQPINRSSLDRARGKGPGRLLAALVTHVMTMTNPVTIVFIGFLGILAALVMHAPPRPPIEVMLLFLTVSYLLLFVFRKAG